MSKNKQKEYLPLKWVKKLEENLNYGSLVNITIDDLEAMSQIDDVDRAYNAYKKYPELMKLFNIAYKNPKKVLITGETAEKTVKETLSDFDAIRTVKLWAMNKQVYKFDVDFLNELLKTENVRLTKDIFDYLPFPVFYLDISDNKALCEEIYCQGLFVMVEKKSSEGSEFWKVHAVKLTDEYFFNDIFITENSTGDRELSEVDGLREIELVKSDLENNILHTVSRKEINSKLFELLVYQVLIYLSSAEPQIEENPITKETYRKPAEGAKPKNKFSEIQSYDVGVRFGSAFRKYKQTVKAKYIGDGSSQSAGRTVRPHARRAHYSHRWYGKRNSGEQVLRPVWIEATFVGVHDDKVPETAVIHPVKADKE